MNGITRTGDARAQVTCGPLLLKAADAKADTSISMAEHQELDACSIEEPKLQRSLGTSSCRHLCRRGRLEEAAESQPCWLQQRTGMTRRGR